MMMSMARQPPFSLVFAPEVEAHLVEIDAKYHSLIRAKIEEQLMFQPGEETRNRKPLSRPVLPGADWKIRFGPDNRFRVFYRIEQDERRVRIAAVGVKVGNRLFIGGLEVGT